MAYGLWAMAEMILAVHAWYGETAVPERLIL